MFDSSENKTENFSCTVILSQIPVNSCVKFSPFGIESLVKETSSTDRTKQVCYLSDVCKS